MTIIGIAGCTGLMLTGFGIRDSVDDIPSAQFDGIFKYDVAITLSNTDGLEKLEEYLNNNEKIENYVKVCATTGEISNGTAKINTTVFVPDSLENYQNAYNLTDYETNETLKIDDDGIIITDKAAEILGVKAGDNITFIDGDDVYYTFKVKNIAKNHVSHYVYMSKDFYEGTETDDYLQITLTDEEDVPDGMAKLRTVYPNLMQLVYDNSRTRQSRQVEVTEHVEQKSEIELFEEFYEIQNNQPMNEEQQNFVKKLLEELH